MSEIRIQGTKAGMVTDKALLTSPKRYICHEGGARCFAAGTMIHCNGGLKAIEQVRPGDKVLTPYGWKKVLANFENKPQARCVEVTMKDGSKFKCTEDHMFLVKGQWVPIKDILNERTPGI